MPKKKDEQEMSDLHIRAPKGLLDDVAVLAGRANLSRPDYVRKLMVDAVESQREQVTLETVLQRMDTLASEVERLRQKVEGDA